MFAVEDIEEVLARLRARGAELVGEMAQYENSFGSATSAALRASSSRWPYASVDDQTTNEILALGAQSEEVETPWGWLSVQGQPVP